MSTVADVERELVLHTLASCNGNRTHAARALGVSVRTLRNRIRLYTARGIDVPAHGSAGGDRAAHLADLAEIRLTLFGERLERFAGFLREQSLLEDAALALGRGLHRFRLAHQPLGRAQRAERLVGELLRQRKRGLAQFCARHADMGEAPFDAGLRRDRLAEREHR